MQKALGLIRELKLEIERLQTEIDRLEAKKSHIEKKEYSPGDPTEWHWVHGDD